MNIYDDYAKKDIDIKNLRIRIKNLEEENRKLKEKIRFLEQCLDNKEEVNKSLRKELERYKKQYEHSMGED